jgi:glycine oxidase
MRQPDAIVVGGGVVGCSVAYHLAREGLAVTLLERDDLAGHASGAAAGMLAPICESTGSGAFFELGLRSLRSFPSLAAELKELSGVDPQLVISGVLRAAASDEEAAHLRESARQLERFGTVWLDAAGAREKEPRISREVLGALWSPEEGHVLSPALALAYAQGAARLGARIERGVTATGLVRDGHRILGVQTTSGERAGGHVVLCAGVWTRFCAEWLDRRLPLEPVRGQILALDAPQPQLSTIVWGRGAYLVPKLNGSIVVGATEERVGFDCRTTAAGVASLLEAAVALAPELARCAFRSAWAGLRPDTPDHLPAVGPIPGVEGVTLAAGHYRNGVLLSPVTGELVAGWILRKELPDAARPLLPERLLRN